MNLLPRNILATNLITQELFFSTLQFHGAATVVALQATRHDVAAHVPATLVSADRVAVDLPARAHALSTVKTRDCLAIAKLRHEPLAPAGAIARVAAEVAGCGGHLFPLLDVRRAAFQNLSDQVQVKLIVGADAALHVDPEWRVSGPDIGKYCDDI